MYIIIGMIIFAAGALIVVKAEAMLSNFGRLEFFERYLGAEGGSRLGYKIVGLIAIFIGFLVMTNLIGGFMEWLLSPLLRVSRGQ